MPMSDEASGSLLHVRGVTREFGGVRALDGVDLSVAPGEQLCIIGPNGCGKTTLFNVITAQLPPTRGEVVFEGRALAGLAPHHIARLGIARKFQVPSVFEDLTVAENLEVACFGLAPSHQRPATATLLEQIQLSDRADVLAGRLPHGARQWLEIGMLLAQNPKLMLVDEPVAGMTDHETEQTALLLKDIARDHAVIVVEHDMSFVRALACRVICLHEGSVLAEGHIDAVSKDDRVIEVYLGR